MSRATVARVTAPRTLGCFWTKVDKSAGTDGCWPWTGARRGRGYGHFGAGQQVLPDGRRRSVNVDAHRASWLIHFGEIPDRLFVCHRCDNPPCVNPAHLFLGTQADNVRDMIEKGRTRYARKLTDADLIEIKAALATKARGLGRILARKYGVSEATIGMIRNGKSWRGVVGDVSYLRVRLTSTERDEIRALRSAGGRGIVTLLAERFGVNIHTIRKVCIQGVTFVDPSQ